MRVRHHLQHPRHDIPTVLSTFRSLACAPNRPGGALLPMAPAELGASWTFKVSHGVSHAAFLKIIDESMSDHKVPFQCVRC